jgi:hypothetical protein
MMVANEGHLVNQSFNVAHTQQVGDDWDRSPLHAAAEIPSADGQGDFRGRLAGWPELLRQILLLKPANQFFPSSSIRLRWVS